MQPLLASGKNGDISTLDSLVKLLIEGVFKVS